MNKQELQSLPTARDPWVVIQLAPSIMLLVGFVKGLAQRTETKAEAQQIENPSA